MKIEDLNQKQYIDHKLENNYGILSFLRKIFKKYDIHRVAVAVSLLEKGNNLLDIGCGEGSLLLMAKNKYTNLYGVDIDAYRLEVARKNFKKEKK